LDLRVCKGTGFAIRVVSILPVLGGILTVVGAPNLVALATYYKIRPMDASVGGITNTRMPLFRAWIVFEPEAAAWV
jgi:hypothetical protein